MLSLHVDLPASTVSLCDVAPSMHIHDHPFDVRQRWPTNVIGLKLTVSLFVAAPDTQYEFMSLLIIFAISSIPSRRLLEVLQIES